VLKIADGIAYINHDLDDAIRASMLTIDDVPEIARNVLGVAHAARIDTLVRDIVTNSQVDTEPATIAMSSGVLEAANALRTYLFANVYRPMNIQEDTVRAQRVLLELCDYYMAHFEEIPAEYRSTERDESPQRQIADYVASMTDRFAIELFRKLFVPRYWSV
jgi:dGTPase